jgi:hypothetical protein
VELGGQFDLLNDSQQKIDPPFFAKVADAGFDSPLSFEKAPKISVEENAEISFTPDNGDWVFLASVRYGRNGTKAYKHQQTNEPNGGLFRSHYNPTYGHFRYAETTAANSESHQIFDFAVGKDVGLGTLGLNGTSTLSGGVRFVQFRSKSNPAVYTDPDYVNTLHVTNIGSFSFGEPGPKYFHDYSAKSKNKTSFTGVGPALSWDASMPVSGNAADGQITFDWALNGAVLFGRQKSVGFHETKGKLSTGLINFPQIGFSTTPPITHMAVRMIVRAV